MNLKNRKLCSEKGKISPQQKHHAVRIIIFLILFAAVSIFAFIQSDNDFLTGGLITGDAVHDSFYQNRILFLNSTYKENSSIPFSYEISSASITGEYFGTGSARVYIVTGNSRLLIYEFLFPQRTLAGTGNVVIDEIYNAENNSEENQSLGTTILEEEIVDSLPEGVYKKSSIRANNDCAETCNIMQTSATEIQFEVDDGILFVESINYAVEGTVKLLKNITEIHADAGTATIINLGEYFQGDNLYFDISSSQGYLHNIDGGVLKITPQLEGTWPATIYAADSYGVIEAEVVVIVGNSLTFLFEELVNVSPESNTTNSTEYFYNEMTEGIDRGLADLKFKVTKKVIDELNSSGGEKIKVIVKYGGLPDISIDEYIAEQKKLAGEYLKTVQSQNLEKKLHNKLEEKTASKNEGTINAEIEEELAEILSELDKIQIAYAIADSNIDSVNRIESAGIDTIYITNLNDINSLAYMNGIEEIFPDLEVASQVNDSINVIAYDDAQKYAEFEFGENSAGRGIKICLIDSGINHSIVLNNATGYDFVNGDADFSDDNGHGTGVAYIIYRLVPEAELVVAKVLNENATGYQSTVLEALEYCAQQNVTIISMSIGSGGHNGYCDSDPVSSYVNILSDEGILIIAASGNSGDDLVKIPACASKALPVASSTKTDVMSYFSAVNANVILLSPGENIITFDSSGGAAIRSGTSMSVPFVTSISAMLKQANSSITPEQLIARLIHTGTIINQGGRNFSRLNAYNALTENITNNFSPQLINSTITKNETIYKGLAPAVSNIVLNATSINNFTTDNLTLFFSASSENANFTDWRLNGTSIAVINAPLNLNITGLASKVGLDYSTYAETASIGLSANSVPVYNSTCIMGGCYNFDGNDVINFSVDSSQAISSGISFGAWARTLGLNSDSGTNYIMNKGYSGGEPYQSWGIISYEPGNELGCTISIGSSRHYLYSGQLRNESSGAFHVFCTYDGSNLRVYVDGQLRNSSALTGSINNSMSTDNSIKIGRWQGSSNIRGFNGSVDEVLVLSRSLSAEQIKLIYDAGAAMTSINTLFSGEISAGNNWTALVGACDYDNCTTALSNSLIVQPDDGPPRISFESPTPDNGLVTISNVTIYANISDSSNSSTWIDMDRSVLGHWAMDFYNSTGIFDNSTYNHFATFNGMSSSGLVLATRGKGIYFDGSNDYLSVPNSNILNPKNVLTVSFSFNMAQTPAARGEDEYMIVRANTASPYEAYNMHLYDAAGRTELLWSVANSSGAYANSATWFNFQPNTWYHVVGVLNGTKLKIYINGIDRTDWSDDWNGNVASGNGAMYIGSYGGTLRFNGTIDELLIINRSISSQEVLALYSATAQKFNATFIDLSPGNHIYSVFAVDALGNRNYSSRYFGTDNASPNIIFEPPTPDNGGIAGNTVNIVANISDASNASAWIDFDRSVLGYWSMESTNSTGVYDNSTYGNNASFFGGMSVASSTLGIRSSAMSFDGDNDYLGIANNSNLNPTKSFSVSFWFNMAQSPESKRNNERLFTRIHSMGAGETMYAELYNNSGNTEIRFGYVNTSGDYRNAGNAYLGMNFSTNIWYHIVCTKNETNLKIYVNGADATGWANPVYGDVMAADSLLRISGAYGGINGSIDEFILFNKSLNLQEVKALYSTTAQKFNATFSGLSAGTHNYSIFAVDYFGNRNSSQRNFSIDVDAPAISYESPTPDNGATINLNSVNIVANISDVSSTSAWIDFDRTLVGYWSMDSYNVTGVHDNSTHNYFGTFGGGINTSNIAQGIRGNSLGFDGLNDYVNLTDISNSNHVTLSAWIYRDAADSDSDSWIGIVNKWDGLTNNSEWAMAEHLGKYSFWVYTVGENYLGLDTDISIPKEEWIHIAMTYNGTYLIGYVNGVNITQGYISGVLNDAPTDVSLGSNDQMTDRYFKGLIDEVLIFNRSLSAAEINALYNSKVNKFNATFTSLSAGYHNYSVFAVDTLGNRNYSARNFTVNSSHIMISANITPIPANTTDTLRGWCNATDANEGYITYFYRWYRNGVLNASGNSQSFVAGVTRNVNNLSVGLQSKFESWIFSCLANDGFSNSSWLNSTGLNISNTPPSNVSLLYPGNGNDTFTNRTPRFIWTAASDADGDSITYTINVSTSAVFADLVYSKSGISTTYQDYDLPAEMQLDRTYYWKVQAYDGTINSSYSQTFNFTLVSYVNIEMVNDEVQFDLIAPGRSNDTLGDNPAPFSIRSLSNTYVNISEMNITKSLWNTQPLGTSYWQIKVRTKTDGSFSEGTSRLEFFNASNMTNIVDRLNYTSEKNNVSIDMNVTVPTYEGSGEKSSTLFFLAEVTK